MLKTRIDLHEKGQDNTFHLELSDSLDNDWVDGEISEIGLRFVARKSDLMRALLGLLGRADHDKDTDVLRFVLG